MIKTKKRHWALLLLTVLTLPLFTAPVHAAGKVTVETDLKDIKANQPFDLIFRFTGPVVPRGSEKPDLGEINSTDFMVLESPSYYKYGKTINGQLQTRYTYIYKLVAKRSGDLTINPWTAGFDQGTVFTSEKISIHISAERISTDDSLKRLHDMEYEIMSKSVISKKSFGQRDLPPLPNGVHFLNADSTYEAQLGKKIKVPYTICFVNVPGIESDVFGKVTMDTVPFPTGISRYSIGRGSKIVAPDWPPGSPSSAELIYLGYFEVWVSADNPGRYTIPEVTFTCMDKKYIAPPIKVIVK